MLTIQEEPEQHSWSRKSSLKSQNSTYEERREEVHEHIPVSRRQSTILDEIVGDQKGPLADAVAYIQAKEVTIEDLRTLGEEIEEEKHEKHEQE